MYEQSGNAGLRHTQTQGRAGRNRIGRLSPLRAGCALSDSYSHGA
jgi:hypothetical protein